MKIRISYQKAMGLIRSMHGKLWHKLPELGMKGIVVPSIKRVGAYHKYPNGVVIGHDSDGYWFQPINDRRHLGAAVAVVEEYNPDFSHYLDSTHGNEPDYDGYNWYWSKEKNLDTWYAPDGARVYWNCDAHKYIVTMA